MTLLSDTYHLGTVSREIIRQALRHEEAALSLAVAEARRLGCEEAAQHLLDRARAVMDIHDELGD